MVLRVRNLPNVRWLVIVALIGIETLSLVTFCTATRMHYIHWNTTNPIFRIDNTDHIIDVNRNNIPFEYDQVNIICPVYSPGTHEEDAEKYIIYNVSKEEYDTCRITNPNPRIIAVCDKPYKLMYFTITFRSFTPQPGGLEFRPGQDYYFISTSSRDDLHRRIGGRCSTHNMKVVFKVCCKADDASDKSPAIPSRPMSPVTTSAPALPPVTTTTSLAPPTRASTTTSPATTTTPSTTSRPPVWKEVEVQSISVRPTNKKTDDYDKLSNEVVKNEELTSKSSSPGSATVSRAATFMAVGVAWLLPRLLLR